MIKIGHWLVSLVFGVLALVQVGAGIAFLAGWMKPETEGVTVPPEMEAMVAPMFGVISILVGLLLALTAWGLFHWRSWGRILAIVLCGLQLFSLAAASFMVRFTPGTIASGVIVVLVLLWLFQGKVQATFAAGGEQV